MVTPHHTPTPTIDNTVSVSRNVFLLFLWLTFVLCYVWVVVFFDGFLFFPARYNFYLHPIVFLLKFFPRYFVPVISSSPLMFSVKKTFLSRQLREIVYHKRKKKQNTHTSGIILEKYYPVPSFPTYTRWNEHFEGARFFYPCVM